MKRINTVKKNEDFTKAIKKGKYQSSKYFTIYKHKNDLNIYRFGISVGKKNGNAVTRNKIKRQMRSIIDAYVNEHEKANDYIIIIKQNYNPEEFWEIKEKFKELIDKLNRRNTDEK